MYDDLRPDLSPYQSSSSTTPFLTPNFERLARKSVVFDYAFCQVAVCNPSRVSLLTGLRPDTTKTWGFQNSFKPHMILPSLLISKGYDTMNYGKLLHWENNATWCWSKGAWRGRWSHEASIDLETMNSTYYPDPVQPELDYLDSQLVSHAIDSLRSYRQNKKNSKKFMMGIGFRMPHLPVRVPKKYFDLYDREPYQSQWNQSKSYPETTQFDHLCCSYKSFSYLSSDSDHFERKDYRFTGHINEIIPSDMHREMMWGYSAAVAYLDTQLGRLLDVLDELNLWDSMVIVLTSDHGMHNGEKGLWKKWTLFDESTRIPLFIAHPSSPFHGQHYPHPVEQIDIFPTLLDLLSVSPQRPCIPRDKLTVCRPLEGKSLYPIIMGQYPPWNQKAYRGNGRKEIYSSQNPTHKLSSLSHQSRSMLIPNSQYAIQQRLICGNRFQHEKQIKKTEGSPSLSRSWKSPWYDCKHLLSSNFESIMGYSYRTASYRYTVWLPFNFTSQSSSLNSQEIITEQLFDHQEENLSNFTHLEEIDLLADSHGVGEGEEKWENIRLRLRNELFLILKEDHLYRNQYLL